MPDPNFMPELRAIVEAVETHRAKPLAERQAIAERLRAEARNEGQKAFTEMVVSRLLT